MSQHSHSDADIIETGVLLAFGFFIFKLLLIGVVLLVWFIWISTADLSTISRRLIRGSIITLTACAGLLVLILLSN